MHIFCYFCFLLVSKRYQLLFFALSVKTGGWARWSSEIPSKLHNFSTAHDESKGFTSEMLMSQKKKHTFSPFLSTTFFLNVGLKLQSCHQFSSNLSYDKILFMNDKFQFLELSKIILLLWPLLSWLENHRSYNKQAGRDLWMSLDPLSPSI